MTICPDVEECPYYTFDCWKLAHKCPIYQKIRYGKRSKHRKYRHMLTDPHRLISSLIFTEPNTDTACMLCVKDEQDTVQYAIDSTCMIVSHYIVVDKNGSTIPEAEKTIKKYNLTAEYHVKPELSLRESREYALSKLKHTWLLILDGDEYLTEEGQKAVLKHRKHPHTYLRTCKNILLPGNRTPLINQGYHSFFYHNNNTITIPKYGDIPIMRGRAVHLITPVIFNNHKNKTPRIKHHNITQYNPAIQGDIPEILI